MVAVAVLVAAIAAAVVVEIEIVVVGQVVCSCIHTPVKIQAFMY